MLHHQHQVHAVPRNQLVRDTNSNVNRMAHPSMSMRLPGVGGQQRPPHPHTPHLVMGMQPPQPTVPGVMVPMVPPVLTAPLQQQAMQATGTEGELRMPGVAAPVSAVAVVPASQPPTSPAHLQPTQPAQGNGGATASTDVILAADEEEQQIILPHTLANTKEKTPMCLINELARFNKITHQYRLTSETGPAHKKRFTVTLKLGDEEYTAEGPSIKKAQHSAAGEALGSTRYEHPPPKTQRIQRMRKINITPTVELNALAMKRGEPTSYTFLEPLPPPYPPNYFRGMSYQRYHYNKPMYGGPSVFFVSLRVGDREYAGQGRTAQAARHDAASKALQELRQLPLPEGAAAAAVVAVNGQENGGESESDSNSDLKSPISLVHELALKRSLLVTFEVVREKGPPHMRTFLTNCRVGELVTEGEGNSKKTSKKRAAERMLDELKKLPALSPPPINPQRLKRKPTAIKKKTRNLIKEQKSKPEYTDDVNPISRLIQIQQAKKEREPEYTLLEERGVPRRREFVMEVSIGLQSCKGSGPNKKLAKRAAAEALLQQMGYSSRPSEGAPGSPATGKPDSSEKTRKVTFLDSAEGKEIVVVAGASAGLQPGGSGGRQLVPGLLLMTDSSAVTGYPQGKAGVNGAGSGGATRQTTAVIAKELLSCGSSPTADALVAAGQMQASSLPLTSGAPPVVAAAPPAVPASAPRAKELLNYLANLLKFSVTYTDFPKVNHSEFLSLVSLATVPPQVFHGAGPNIDASHDQAANSAMQWLSELGLDTVEAQQPADGASGDGLHLMGGVKSAVTSNGK